MQDTENNYLPRPIVCDCCGSHRIRLTTELAIYRNQHTAWGLLYHCTVCTALVGVHSGTSRPLGTLANKRNRKLRSYAHKFFDKLWKNGHLTRPNAYLRLAHTLNIEKDKCHIAMFNEIECQNVIDFCKKELHLMENTKPNYTKGDRRKRNKKNGNRHGKSRRNERNFR